MSAAALPTRPSEHRGDGVLQPLVGIGGNQLHPAEPSSGQRPQEGQPEGAVLAGAHVHTQDLTLPFGIDPRGHHHADVHDAAALDTEVADHDAELWYVACFAGTTSLQVVRLFRRQRAELPRRNLMGEAYLVVLAQLAMEAEESREHLEDTAIPDLDDGLTDARAALLAEAHAAMGEMTETVAADLRAFNQDLPVEIRPAMQGLPAVTERAAALVV